MSVTNNKYQNVEIICNNILSPQWDETIDKLDFNKKNLRVFLLSVSELSNHLNICFGILDNNEKIKADRFHQSAHRNRFIISHAVLKLLSAKYLNKSPLEIKIIEGKNNKPYILGEGDLNFNISHSGNNTIIVFNSKTVGVDIEELNQSFNFHEIMGEVFNDIETRVILKALSPTLLFYKLWTRKEALIKATAKGIDDDFRLLSCLDGTNIYSGQFIDSELNWQIDSFNINDGLICSLAYEFGQPIDPQFYIINNNFLLRLFKQ